MQTIKQDNRISFIIVTAGENPQRTLQCIESIAALDIPTYEVLVIGPQCDYGIITNIHVRFVHMDNDNWITHKKNAGARLARYSNLVVMHDYFMFAPDWYEEFIKFNESEYWDILSCPQYLMNGMRHFTDWVIWDHPKIQKYTSLDYDNWDETMYQYVSGGFFICKANVLRDNKFNEDMRPGQPEDIEWSLRVRHKYVMKCNKHMVVVHNKKHRDCR